MVCDFSFSRSLSIAYDLHVYNNNVALARKWYDNVIAATSYIGPMVTRTPPRSPTGFRIVP